MACKIIYKGISYDESDFKNQIERYVAINNLFNENESLANAVYEALGFKSKPDVILPIGTSGSGKSTFIKSLPKENLVVIEPDAMRVEFTGDINNKSKDKEIYEEAANRAVQAIKQGKQVVFDTTNLTKDKRLPFIEAIKKAMPTANIQYKLMELNPELAKQRIKAQLARGENRANVPDSTIDRHAESYKQMLEDIKSEPISNFEITPQQKQQAQQLYQSFLDTVFPDSKVKDIVYHGSYTKINQFEIRKEPLIHFGTKNAALQRGDVLHQVLLNVKNLQTIKDGMWFLGTDEGGLLKELVDRNILTFEQVKSINEAKNKAIQQSQYFSENYRMALPEGEKAGNKKLQEIFKDKGIGFEYINVSEDKGSTSYAVPSQEQIHILGSKQDIEGFKKFVTQSSTSISEFDVADKLTPIAQNFKDGTGGRKMQPQFKGKSTMDLIISGDRTRTTRAKTDIQRMAKDYGLSKISDLVGKVIRMTDNTGRQVYTRITKVTPFTQEYQDATWQKEGWEKSVTDKLVGDYPYAIEFEVVNRTNIQSTNLFVASGAKNFAKKNLFTVTPIQAADKKAIIKASIATQYIGFGEGITGSSTESYRQQILDQANLIDFQEEQSSGYIERTRKNASADATIDFGLNQVGESWTKKAVDNNKKKYIGVNTNNLTIISEMVNEIVESLNSVNAKTLNIAGMGIYTMKNNTQEQVDKFVYDLLKQVVESPNLKTKIESIRTGGQTGFDEAGAKAGQKLGIKTIILAPKGYIFRNKEGKDIANKQQFESRFNQSNIVNSGNYSSNDVIFVSIGGKRGTEEQQKTQQDRTIKEAIKAVEAGATILTDNKAYIDSSNYNTGEQRLYKNMEAKGYNYSEVTVDGQIIGTWSKQVQTTSLEDTINKWIEKEIVWKVDTPTSQIAEMYEKEKKSSETIEEFLQRMACLGKL